MLMFVTFRPMLFFILLTELSHILDRKPLLHGRPGQDGSIKSCIQHNSNQETDKTMLKNVILIQFGCWPVKVVVVQLQYFPM